MPWPPSLCWPSVPPLHQANAGLTFASGRVQPSGYKQHSILATIADNQTKKIQKSASGQFKIAVESIKNSLLPFGEEMLKIATKIIRAIESIVKRIEDLPGPIKNILKIGSAIALIAGPVLMIGGLFKNLFGNLFAKLFITIFSINPSGPLISLQLLVVNNLLSISFLDEQYL